MTLKRETKGTNVFEGDEPITSLYIKKEAFKGKEAPKSITVEIKEI
jgi:hypothetical protein